LFLAIESWLNSFGVDPTITDVNTDLRDGIVLLQVVDKIHPGKVDWRKVVKSPENKWKRMENCDYAVQLIKDLGVPLKGIVGTDIENGDPGLTLALCWQLMSHSMLQFIKNLKVDGKEVTEKDLLQWANEKVPEKVRIESFKDASLRSGQFLLYLLEAVEPGCINWKFVHIVPEFEQTEEKNMQNMKYIVSVAWKLGMKNSFISWQDIGQAKGKTVELFVASAMIYAHSKSSVTIK
jgi:plastin-1